LVPTAAKSAASSALSVISAGNGQLNPALASRFKVNRTVDGATPTPSGRRRPSHTSYREGSVSVETHENWLEATRYVNMELDDLIVSNAPARARSARARHVLCRFSGSALF
jgi:hypothetical protein